MSRPDSIRKIGLKKYLHQTRDKHNDLGHAIFCIMYNAGASVNSIAKSFNVTRFTVDKWIALHREELAADERTDREAIKKG